jgi:ABC-2 type transport system ATP-binding protein
MHQARQEASGGQTTPSSDAAIQVRSLAKSYGEVRALENVSFAVRSGEVFAYLGPNGAGKTTTINIMSGLLLQDAGEVQVCGLDVTRDPVAVKQRIGVVPEESNLYPELSCRRNLEYLGELYGLSRAARRKRTDDLLTIFDLTDKATAPFRALSRGLKRRLTVAATLVHSPEVLFLDEPTTGLDVPSARALRSLIRALNRAWGRGTTVFLTTHNLAEAEALSDRVLVLVKGRVVTAGTPAEIRQQVEKAKTVSVTFSGDVAEGALRKGCPAVRSVSPVDGAWRLEVTDTHAAVAQLVSFAEKEGLRVSEIGTITPTLEDAFVAILEGHSGREEAGN